MPPPHFFLSLNRLVIACLVLSLAALGAGCAGKTPLRGLDHTRLGAKTESMTARVGQELAERHLADLPAQPDFPEEKDPTLDENSAASADNLTQALLATAFTQVGKAYRYGGNSPTTGFDCSGFVQWVFGQHGMNLPRSTKDQSKTGVPVPKEALRPGDLVFYWRGRHRRSKHVGIYTGEGKFIHSPQTGSTITEEPAFDSYRRSVFIEARRVYDDPKAAPLALDRKRTVVKKAYAANRSVAARRSESSRPRTYVVKSGDTLWSLSRRFGVSTSRLMKANGLSARHTLNIGQKLSIP